MTYKDPYDDNTTGNLLTDIIANILFTTYILLTVIVIFAFITFVSVEVASWIWGDVTVTYWIADLIS